MNDELELEGQEGQTVEKPDVEERAQRMGWRPKDQFHGDPDNFVDAEEFVARAAKYLPVAKERIEYLDKKLRETEATIKGYVEDRKRVEERALQRALKVLEKKHAEAYAAGDIDQYRQVQEEIIGVKEDILDNRRPTAPPPEDDPVFGKWRESNSWYGNDKDMTSFADSIGKFYNETQPGLRGKDFLETVAEDVRRKYPNKFSNPKRDNPSPVDGEGSYGVKAKKGGKSYGDLPPEAKQACDMFVKQGLFKDRGEYIEDYFKYIQG